MKFSAITLAALISIFAGSQGAYANQENNPNPPIENPNQAATLLTEPATITTKWNSVNGQTDNLNQTAKSISIVQNRECQNLNPLEFINHANAIIKKCQNPTNNQNSQRSSDPIEYLKVPRLDSGIKLTITKF